ncbi:MAG TPA: efflux RND transporter permease subunit, partial [Armatimonadota bacterium]|nr:efflux RND transporter permease subunit [Armatimonadota bacterium]
KGKELEEIVKETPGVADVKLNQASGIPQLQVRIDRQAAARHGISVAAIAEALHLAVGGEELAQVWKDQRSYGVYVRFADDVRSDPEALGNILIDTPSGTQIPLSQVAEVVLTEGPNVIWREAMSRRINVDANIQGRDLAGVVEDIKKDISKMDLPQDYFVVFGGQYENQQRAMRSLVVATIVALAVVFMLLFLALSSSVQAGMILATVPSAFIGGVASLLLTGETINVSSAVGFIALFGIAVQNSLVLLTQTKEFISEGQTKEKAIRLASINRLRPKLMTVSSTALGVVPILLSSGKGAEIEKPLAIVLIGGLITSTLFTLLVLPAVYLLVEGRKREGEKCKE